MTKPKTLKQENSLFIPYLVLLAAVVIAVFPFVWTFIASTHSNTEIFTTGMAFTPSVHLAENYAKLMAYSNIWINLCNSLFIAIVATLLVCAVAAMAGYGFSKFRFRGRDTIFFVCACSMFIPQQVTLVPQYMQMTTVGLINTPWAVILPKLGQIFGVFLMRQNLLAFPDELIESARIDGAGECRTFLRIVVPTMKPAFASLGILTFVQCWGDYLWPLITLNDKASFTLPLVLALLSAGANVIEYGALMVGAVLTLLPILVFFLCFQKNFISGLLSGAVKG